MHARSITVLLVSVEEEREEGKADKPG